MKLKIINVLKIFLYNNYYFQYIIYNKKMDYNKKYLKYKQKYLELKKIVDMQKGGTSQEFNSTNNLSMGPPIFNSIPINNYGIFTRLPLKQQQSSLKESLRKSVDKYIEEQLLYYGIPKDFQDQFINNLKSVYDAIKNSILNNQNDIELFLKDAKPFISDQIQTDKTQLLQLEKNLLIEYLNDNDAFKYLDINIKNQLIEQINDIPEPLSNEQIEISKQQLIDYLKN
jgi:hypothetical protein